eukprot:Skav200728  [mRNA]  locus=scaffold274:25283:38105:- [translate_table: standard]
MLDQKDRAELKQFEQNCKQPSEEIWDFLLEKKLVKDEMCSRHLSRSGLESYDIFVLEEFVSVVAKPDEIYSQLVSHVQAGVPPVELAHVAWEKSEQHLREEMLAIANEKCSLTEDQILAMDLSDWQPLLSEEERKKYAGYLNKLNMNDLPKEDRPVRAVCVAQNPEDRPMMGSATSLPSFTTDSTKRTMMTHLDRWLTAREKAALTGFPVHEDSLLASSMLEQVRQKRAQKEAEAAPAGGPPHDVATPCRSSQKQSPDLVSKTIEAINRIKTWLLESMALCMKDPEAAVRDLLALVGDLKDKHPPFESVAVDLGLGGLESDVDLGTLGPKLAVVEKDCLAIQEELNLAAKPRKRRGRPYGSRNKPAPDTETADAKAADGEDGPLMTPPKKSRKKGRKGKQAGLEKSEQKPGPDTVEGEPPVSTDPFGDLEKPKDPNKCTTISLYAKCLVVQFAQKLADEGNVHNIEKEVMKRFPKYFWPTIADATRDALPGRNVHIWQMEDLDANGDPQDEGWVNLPVLLQQFADRNLAKYQLDKFEAEKRLAAGELKQSKLDAIVNNAKRPLVLMHCTGEPATAKYIKDHLIRDTNGSMKLKDWTFPKGSRATIILFDFKEKNVKIGVLEPRKLRIVQATVQFDSLHLELDKDFLKEHRSVPGLEMYGSQDSEEEEDPGQAEAQMEEDLAANGMWMVPVPAPTDPEEAACMTLAPWTGADDQDDSPDKLQNDLSDFMLEGWEDGEDETYMPGLEVFCGEAAPGDEADLTVEIDAFGNLVTTSDENVEVVDHESKAPEQTGLAF